MSQVRSSESSPRRKDADRDVGLLRPGMDITPNVRLVRRIGEGAMGDVWLADHLALKTRVAVKCISKGIVDQDDESLARFRREASTAARIKSPHVVHVLDTGVTDQGVPYIVMEHLEGETLGERLHRKGWLSLQQTARIVAHVAKALNTAHREGIVHRDIKPDNIFLMHTDDGLFCKLFDFGIAKQTRVPSMRGITDEGTVVGTLEYMSPEQMKLSSDVSFRADLWALGVVAYCTLTGRLPFSGTGMGELCLNIMHVRYTPPGSYRKDLPPELDQWFARVFHTNPTERFDSAREMALELVRIATRAADTLEDELKATAANPLSLPPPDAIPTKRTAQSDLAAAATAHAPDAPETTAPEPEPAAEPSPEEPAADVSPTRTWSRGRVIASIAAAMLLVAAISFGLGRSGTQDDEPTEGSARGSTRSEPVPTATAATNPTEETPSDEPATTASTTAPEPTPTATATAAATARIQSPTSPPQQTPEPHGKVKPGPPAPSTAKPSPGFPVPDDPDF